MSATGLATEVQEIILVYNGDAGVIAMLADVCVASTIVRTGIVDS